jgi:DNA-binding response OmpR family regulator
MRRAAILKKRQNGIRPNPRRSRECPLRETSMEAGTRVLVVDDRADIRELIALSLSAEGYRVRCAEDGMAALLSLMSELPDVILLDLNMPIMDGWEFARIYRAFSRDQAPLVVMSAALDGRAAAAKLQADGYLAKPFELDDLLGAVREAARIHAAV